MSLNFLITNDMKNKKIIARNFRLRESEAKALEALSEKINVSQNEIVNLLLEETNQELKLLNKIDELIQKDETFYLKKEIQKDIEIIILFKNKQYYYVIKNIKTKLEINKTVDLLNIIDSTYKLYYKDIKYKV